MEAIEGLKRRYTDFENATPAASKLDQGTAPEIPDTRHETQVDRNCPSRVDSPPSQSDELTEAAASVPPEGEPQSAYLWPRSWENACSKWTLKDIKPVTRFKMIIQYSEYDLSFVETDGNC